MGNLPSNSKFLGDDDDQEDGEIRPLNNFSQRLSKIFRFFHMISKGLFLKARSIFYLLKSTTITSSSSHKILPIQNPPASQTKPAVPHHSPDNNIDDDGIAVSGNIHSLPDSTHDSPAACSTIVVDPEKNAPPELTGKDKVINVVVDHEAGIWIRHYNSRHWILLVGEGDFSFSASLARAFGRASKMIATSLDSEKFLKKNYPEAPSNIAELRKRGCKVMHCIDATEMAYDEYLGGFKYDRIVYNFPYAGFFQYYLSRDETLRCHRRLVSLFLKNAKGMLSENGEIHITHKTNGFHWEWNIVNIASSHGLRLIEAPDFNLFHYPGYKTKRGFGGNKNFDCQPSKTYKFGLKYY